jgi:hypothetical protein
MAPLTLTRFNNLINLMNMKFYVLLVFCLLYTGVYSQVDVNRFTNIVQSVTSGSAAYGAGFQGRYNSSMEVVGDVYLDSAFQNSSFIMKGKAPALVTPARFDILNNEFEVKTTGGTKLLNGDFVNSYRQLKNGDSVTFINASNYKFEETVLVGFLEILSDGSIQLLSSTKLNVIKPTYNASLDVGDKNAYVKRKETLYYAMQGQLYKVGGKKDLLKLFGGEAGRINSFIDSNKLNVKNTPDLKRIFQEYNSIKLKS